MVMRTLEAPAPFADTEPAVAVMEPTAVESPEVEPAAAPVDEQLAAETARVDESPVVEDPKPEAAAEEPKAEDIEHAWQQAVRLAEESHKEEVRIAQEAHAAAALERSELEEELKELKAKEKGLLKTMLRVMRAEPSYPNREEFMRKHGPQPVTAGVDVAKESTTVTLFRPNGGNEAHFSTGN